MPETIHPSLTDFASGYRHAAYLVPALWAAVRWQYNMAALIHSRDGITTGSGGVPLFDGPAEQDQAMLCFVRHRAYVLAGIDSPDPVFDKLS